MSKHSSFHLHIEWAKERLEEMDAALASLERHARAKEAEIRDRADQLIAEMRKRRDDYRRTSDAALKAAADAWPRDKALLDKCWDGFSKDLDTYVRTFGKEAELQRGLFQDSVAVQRNAWYEAVDRLDEAAAKIASHRRDEINGILRQVKADASKFEAKIQKLNRAGDRSWAELDAELAKSRAAFDNAVLRLVGEMFDDEAESSAKTKHGGRAGQ